MNLEGTTLALGFNITAMKQKYPCPIFDRTVRIEALLYVEESFRKLAKKLNYGSEKGFNSWELCLADSALDHWENINDAINPYRQNGT